MDLTGRVKGVQWVITFGSGRAWKSPRSVSLGTDTRRSYPVRAGFGWRTLKHILVLGKRRGFAFGHRQSLRRAVLVLRLL